VQLADGILTISAPGKAVEDRFIVGRVQLISGFPIVFSAPCGVAVQIARRITVHARGISSVVVKIIKAVENSFVTAGVELEVVLPIVNAPFRFYYAYNYLRLNRTIEAPLGAYSLTDAQKAALPPGVLQTQIVPELSTLLQQAQASQRIPPSLLEPKSTFRFTVGRTF